MDDQPRRLTPALTVSIAVHAATVLTLIVLARSSDVSQRSAPPNPSQKAQLIWVPDSRPPARGGGAPAQATKPTTTAPAILTPQPLPIVIEPPAIVPEPAPRVTSEIDAPMSDAPADKGAVNRASTGDGGDRPGSGTGPDTGPGNGGVVFGVGNGVTSPIPLRRPPPAYTTEAMRARLQGVVVLNCVVQPDGTCSDIRVLRSLDAVYGLDQKAIASAREWRFRPGLRLGAAVPVQVTLEIAFNIR